jgi:hypothetical protein
MHVNVIADHYGEKLLIIKVAMLIHGWLYKSLHVTLTGMIGPVLPKYTFVKSKVIAVKKSYMKNNKGYDIYTKLGSVVTAIPSFVIISIIFKNFEKDIYEVIGAPAVSVKYILWGLAQICMIPFNRIISIKYEDWVQGGEMNSCLINTLMGRNKKMSEVQMKKLREKVNADLGDELPTEEEIATLDENIIRRRLLILVRNINDRMKNCSEVRRYRNGYVDTRKLVSSNISAIFLTALFCTYLAIVKEYSLFILFFGILYFYIIYLLANIFLLKWYGGKYAKSVLEKYLSGCPDIQPADKEMRA